MADARLDLSTRQFCWSQLSSEDQKDLLQRPTQRVSTELTATVNAILAAVRTEGDAAVLRYTRQFDCESLTELRYPAAAIARQLAKLPVATKAAIDTAYGTIRKFHEAQRPQGIKIETAPGIECELRYAPMAAVGLYVPGGTAVLPSTALMLGVPAQLAECPRVVLVSPPDADGELAPALLYAAQCCGITEIYRCGGAQAIAALAYGTESIGKVNKIFGPGNSFVTAAKQAVSQDPSGAAIDMPAGPSELLVIADDQANPAYVAADLLSQAEHGADSQVVLLSDSAALIAAVREQLETQLQQLSRATTARQALANSALVEVADLDQAVAISQSYAPEHLSVQTAAAEELAERLTHVGSLFIGPYTPESGGDYATGTNHVLPTYGFASTASSLGLLDFYRRYTSQKATRAGLAGLASAIVELAQTEGLDAHARAVTVRLEESS
ncbi:histidinol dehydrogenase [Pseudidiomarina sp. 1ASP75-14]|uniref:histidinol dehydrogenase n=1 Tax=Pseudidiomarina terrestris TaxID=2820060 RepID=UPI002651678B|nr:histidinol dehydrogenase [Pseudidiomarina sp. 1ASP75-14]MDN7137555.1 histidinol dehydrogenase [Pseudidiomarina sp. 1ASP75-14]